jgi:Rad3-related DNA helicase
VDFPYDAYDCQVTMMERVVEALHDGEHALLESPTGRHPLTSTYDPPLLASTT